MPHLSNRIFARYDVCCSLLGRPRTDIWSFVPLPLTQVRKIKAVKPIGGRKKRRRKRDHDEIEDEPAVEQNAASDDSDDDDEDQKALPSHGPSIRVALEKLF